MADPDMDIKELKGVGAKTAKELEEAGRGTLRKLATANPDKLPDYTSLGDKKSRDLVNKAREELRDGNRFQTGRELEKEQNNMGTITTGSRDFDSMLRGGVGVEYLTEAYGLSSSAKTQLAFQLSVNAQLPEDACKCPECGEYSLSMDDYKENPCCENRPLEEDFKDETLFENNVIHGGAGNGDKVIFIDVEETFRADRIREMAESHGLDEEEVLENIHVTRPTDLNDQEQAIKDARQLNLEDVALIVIDSIVGHVRAEFEGREEYGERADRIGNMLSELQKMASGDTGHEIAVFYTNQAGKDPAVQYGDPVYAYGPSTLEHRSSFRLRLDSRGSKGFNAELIDSPNLKQTDIYFDVFKEGIRDQDFESEEEE